MKTKLLLAGIVIGVSLSLGSTANAALYIFQPSQGGTGTSTAPTYGKILVGTSAGVYQLQATSTLGLGGGSGTVTSIATTWPVIGGTITTTGTLSFGGLSTSTAAVLGNLPYFSGVNTFANVATTSLTASSPLSLSQAISVIGSSASALSLDTSGTWSGNAGTVTNGVYTTTFANLFDVRLTATTSLPQITTLGALSLPYSQLTGTPTDQTASTTLLGDVNTFSTAATTTFSGNAKIVGNLQVDGMFFAPVTLVSSGNTTINGDLTVTGATTLATSLTGLLKAASGVVSVASAGVDYENILTAGDGLTRTVNDFDLDIPVLVASGGTGVTSFTANSLLYSNSGGTGLAFAATSTLNIGGNAGTATVLQTARTINGVSFNGSANITVASTTLLADVNTWTNTQGMSITGNAATVTTNANLSGVVTSSGNTTSFGSQTAGVLGSAVTGNTGVMATSTLYGAGGIPNTALALSTISGISLGSNLAALTNDATLSGSSYNGSAAISDWGLNLANANTWTALQTFGNASTTQIGSTGSAYFATAGGNVGIGTTGPANKLEVQTSADNAQPVLTLTSTGTNGRPYINFRKSGPTDVGYVGPAAAGSDDMYVGTNVSGADIRLATVGTGDVLITNGNVGIGTTSPGKKLEVNGTIYASGSTGYLGVGPRDGSGNDFVWYNPTGDDIRLNNNADLMTILNTGNVGIGTTGPTAGKLVVSGGATNSIATIAASLSGGANAVNLGDDGTDAVIGVGNSSTKLHFLSRVAGVYSRAMTIDSAGNVGIGTTSPLSTLAIKADGTLAIPYATNPSITRVGELGVNTTAASSSLRFFDGTAERALSDVQYKTFTIASSTWLAAKGATATSTIPIGTASPHGETWTERTCYTDSAGTAEVELGDGTNWMPYHRLTTTASTNSTATNNTFTAYEKRYIRVGRTATAPDYITCSVGVRETAD